MKGWIILALLAGALYYLYTETDKLDKPIASAEELMNKIERKLDSMTGTSIIKVDRKKTASLKSAIAERLSTPELAELNQVLTSSETLVEFKAEYCISPAYSHPVFSKDNLQFICDHL